jgi:hypothetical protein
MGAADLDPALAAALEETVAALGDCRDLWWLIGSAAMALHGAAVEVRDLDVLVSRRDARSLLERRGLPIGPGQADERFHSEIFGRWDAGGRAVELFAGFKVRSAGEWQELLPQTRECKRIGAASLFVPSVAELIAWGRLFGRPKDAARESLLLGRLSGSNWRLNLSPSRPDLYVLSAKEGDRMSQIQIAAQVKQSNGVWIAGIVFIKAGEGDIRMESASSEAAARRWVSDTVRVEGFAESDIVYIEHPRL